VNTAISAGPPNLSATNAGTVARLNSAGAALSRPHALRHEALLGRTVKRFAFRTHRFASTGVPFALFHETHLRGTVERLTARAYRLAVTRLRGSRTDRETGNQRG